MKFGHLVLLLALSLSPLVFAGCPFSHKGGNIPTTKGAATPNQRREFAAALAQIDFNAVKRDLKALFLNSNPFWPADFGNYGPFMIRQAWHCTGSYRIFDGHGGCDGGRQRFDPERSWDDNTNLDKAKVLLWPIKQKYGLGLSWGDLIVLAGNTAIESMGGPVLGFCAGRIDDYDGSASELLGPTDVQNATYPCPVNGKCKSPLGTTTIGLIYVNPEGPMGNPIPAQSALEVRDAFGRMNMDDSETVALIGGGHAFGKTHGACPLGPGPSPKEDPSNPWPGLCGTGKGKDAFTSGFEGPWTTTPTRWGNLYYQELLQNQWQVRIGPGGKHQWATVNGTPGIMMLTSDISLLNDPAGRYQQYVKMFASNLTLLNDAFAHAWYKLTTRDMGPVTRCTGPWVPPAQPFQFPLPPTPAQLPDFNQVRKVLQKVMVTASSLLPPDYVNGSPYYGAVFVHLAFQCASTFRSTDYLGGCNGARIRFPPQTNYPANVAMTNALQLLAPVVQQFTNLSWADTIVLAGNVALDAASGSQVRTLSFCGGRTDATDGSGSAFLQPNGDVTLSIDQMKIAASQSGLTNREYVALAARLRSPGQLSRMGYMKTSWTTNAGVLSNQYFLTLLGETWDAFVVPGSGKTQYKARGKEVYMLPVDLNIRWDSDFLAIAQDFASDNSLFLAEFASAWTKLMNIDRFDGPAGNVCDQVVARHYHDEGKSPILVN